MDCLLNTNSCKGDGLCKQKCCQSLVCDKEDHMHLELQHAFWEQSNYYRKMIALTCPQVASLCQTRAKFFSEQLASSPIYNTDCDQLHKTTIMSDSCKRVIINYCSSEVKEDKGTCDTFLSTGELFTMHDWSTECDQALADTRNSLFPNVTLVCYEYLLNQCSNSCGCFWGERTGENTIQLVPCPFYVWSPVVKAEALNISVIVMLLIFSCIFYFSCGVFSNNKKT